MVVLLRVRPGQKRTVYRFRIRRRLQEQPERILEVLRRMGAFV